MSSSCTAVFSILELPPNVNLLPFGLKRLLRSSLSPDVLSLEKSVASLTGLVFGVNAVVLNV